MMMLLFIVILDIQSNDMWGSGVLEINIFIFYGSLEGYYSGYKKIEKVY